MDTDKLIAGRDLDTLVAEKVIGLISCDKWVSENLGSAGGPVMVLGGFRRGTEEDLSRCVKEGKTLDEVIGLPCEHGYNRCYPIGKPSNYSENISAAWQVMETLASKYFINIWNDGEYWCCSLVSEETDKNKFVIIREDADTVPLAICKAALKVIEKQGDFKK